MKSRLLKICTLLLLLYSCNMGTVIFELTDSSFILSGEVQLADPIILEPTTIEIPNYPDSYVYIIPNYPGSYKYTFKTIISLKDYIDNQAVDDNSEWGNLPGDRPLPRVRRLGGSGVGNGFLPMQETDWEYGPIRIYQHKKQFGIYISMPIRLARTGEVYTKSQKSNGQKIESSLVGKISIEENYGDGIFIRLKSIRLP